MARKKSNMLTFKNESDQLSFIMKNTNFTRRRSIKTLETTQERLLYALEQANMTQETLAESSGLGIATVNRVFNGRTKARKDTIERLADALDVRLEWILCEDEYMTIEDMEKAEEKRKQLESSATEEMEELKQSALEAFANAANYYIVDNQKGIVYIVDPSDNVIRMSKHQYDQFSEGLYAAFTSMLKASLSALYLPSFDDQNINHRKDQ